MNISLNLTQFLSLCDRVFSSLKSLDSDTDSDLIQVTLSYGAKPLSVQVVIDDGSSIITHVLGG